MPQPNQKAYDDRKSAIRVLYTALTRYNPSPILYYKIHPTLGNVEYIISPNVGLEQANKSLTSLTDSPEEKALQFLQRFEYVFLPRTKTLRYRLYLKHTLHSQMGTHCIFGYRYLDKEVTEVSFVVHLDNNQHILMVSSTYDPEVLSKMDQDTRPSHDFPHRSERGASFSNALKALLQQNKRLIGKVSTDILWVPDADSNYRPRLEVKISTEDQDMVLYLDDQGNIDQSSYSLRVGAAPGKNIIARVYNGFWEPAGHKSQELEDVLFDERPLKKVILRDLDLSKGSLFGRYVAVRDNIVMDLWRELGLSKPPEPEISSSVFDRVMVYYHLDLVQRYFRNLGLTVLDEYEQFNPMHVVLGDYSETEYLPIRQEICLARLAHKDIKSQDDEVKCTQGREAKVIYHEFVHAITDALCRLRRNDLKRGSSKPKSSPRLWQVYQAAAMDEGLADYFACSLAARHGATRPYFYILTRQQDDPGLLAWSGNIRKIGGRTMLHPRKYQLPRYSDRIKLNEQVIYRWGEQWSRYLWTLRCELEPDIADTIITHSIFFLTRWSDFGMGILAIMLADQLLFDRAHEEQIMRLSDEGVKFARDWEVLGTRI